MNQPSSEHPTDLEVKTKFYLELIQRIDAILEDPVKTLLRVTDEYIKRTEDEDSEPTGFPVWMSDYLQPEPGDDLFTKTICFSAIQEIGKLRRRFSWLSDADTKLLRRLLRPDQPLTPNRLIKNLLTVNEDDFFDCVRSLSSRTFGALNPFSASQVFQVLLRDSEREAHGALGFLAFFGMIWPLYRRFPDPQQFGAAIAPWEPKAFVTAKCILPIKTLQDICTERATSMNDIVDILERLGESAEKEKNDPNQRWLFNAELDSLRARLLRLSSIVVAKDKLRQHSDLIRKFSDGVSQNSGSSVITVEDLKKPAELIIKLREPRDPLSSYIKGQFTPKTRQKLVNFNGSGAPSKALLAALVAELNMLVQGPPLYQEERFAGVALSDQALRFVQQKPRGSARLYFNWLLLKEAYPEEISLSQGVGASYEQILQGAAKAIKDIGEGGVGVFRKADELLKSIDTEIVKRLEPDSQNGLPTKIKLEKLDQVGFKFAKEYREHPNEQIQKDYFVDLYTAARKALGFCRDALDTLNKSYSLCATVTSDRTSITDIARKLAQANLKVAEKMDHLVKNATVWCRTVADREIAHASARNLTDFDPSELVSAIAVAVKWNQMTTALQVSDAVAKALAGMREDGSWGAGQPFYSPNNAVGIWPVTSDVVLTLTEALEEHREVEVADAALVQYVNWLERTRTQLNFPSNKVELSPPKHVQAVGWASDRFRHRRKIHFPTTAFSVNALLKIRDLIEYRLWQLCEKRFTVIKTHERNDLKKVAPVDLGAQHEYRLHRHLAWIAERQKTKYEQAEYSLVLHGPPGSSKTAIAKSLSVEQWKVNRPFGSKEGPRLIRITPADFTRMGEDRLDSEARLIFDLISGVRGVTIFFDEIDDLLRQRNAEPGSTAVKPSFMELVVPAMLNRLADLRDACPRQELSVLLATNFVESIEPALLRKGRIDRTIPVVYPDQESRHALIIKFTRELANSIETALEIDEIRIARLLKTYSNRFAAKLSGWPYLTIETACRKVVFDLTNALRKLGTEAGKTLPLKERRERFLSELEESTSQVVEEFSSGVSTPRYEDRLGKSPFRQELLDEFAHFIVAARADGDDLEQWVINEALEPMKKLSGDKSDQALNKLRKIKALCGKMKLVLENENRWTEHRRIRDVLATAASLELP